MYGDLLFIHSSSLFLLWFFLFHKIACMSWMIFLFFSQILLQGLPKIAFVSSFVLFCFFFVSIYLFTWFTSLILVVKRDLVTKDWQILFVWLYFPIWLISTYQHKVCLVKSSSWLLNISPYSICCGKRRDRNMYFMKELCSLLFSIYQFNYTQPKPLFTRFSPPFATTLSLFPLCIPHPRSSYFFLTIFCLLTKIKFS